MGELGGVINSGAQTDAAHRPEKSMAALAAAIQPTDFKVRDDKRHKPGGNQT